MLPRLACVVVWAGLVGCTVPNPNLATEGSTETTSPGTGGTQAPSSETGGTSTGSDSGIGTTGATGTTGEMGCEPGETCLPSAPDDWSGPVAVLSLPGREPKPACPAGYSTEALLAFSGLTVADSTCDCDCETPEGTLCGSSFLAVHDHDTCNRQINSWSVGPSCVDLEAGYPTELRFQAEPPPVIGGSCNPVDVFVHPTPTWTTQVLGCTPDTGLANCETNGVCGPAVNEDTAAGHCIFRSGAFSCPPGQPYGTWQELYKTPSDERACEACSCGDPEGTCTGGTVTLFVDRFCAKLGAGTVVADGSCTAVPASASGARNSNQGTPEASCTPSTSTLSGTVEPAELVTVCCL